MDLVPTPSQTVGPFFHFGLTAQRATGSVATPSSAGERIRLAFRVLDADGAPVNDAMVEIWQANAEGKYRHPDDWQQKSIDPSFHGFGRMPTDEDGRCIFETIRPGRVPCDGEALQAPHINVLLFARGLLRRLATRVYFADDPANREDPVLALVPEELRGTLMAQPDLGQPSSWHFDIHLGGERETIFFDV